MREIKLKGINSVLSIVLAQFVCSLFVGWAFLDLGEAWIGPAIYFSTAVGTVILCVAIGFIMPEEII